MNSGKNRKSENLRFRSLNQWLEHYLPNFHKAQETEASDPGALGERLAKEAVDRVLQRQKAKKRA